MDLLLSCREQSPHWTLCGARAHWQATEDFRVEERESKMADILYAVCCRDCGRIVALKNFVLSKQRELQYT